MRHQLRPRLDVSRFGKRFMACLNLGLSPVRENVLHRGAEARQAKGESKWKRAGWCSTGRSGNAAIAAALSRAAKDIRRNKVRRK